ncbi:MAG: hypothetical protein MRZ79_07855 [Bacteroidia bacterium]|nr:hypothetical protein [Bacteroidia bacterium]
MKINLKYLVLGLLCGLTLVPAQGQRRNVVWMQGLGENSTVWNVYRNLFDAERCINGRIQNANTDDGINTFANAFTITLAGNMGAAQANSPQNIAVGHSMGGVVARSIDQGGVGLNFGGIVTVGSPNNGADIVNSEQAGDVEDVLEDGCNQLARGPASQLPLILTIVVNGWLRQDLCNQLATDVVPQVLEDNTGLISQSANELAVGSPEMVTLNNNITNTPKISIVGNENGPIHWRMASSFLTANQDDQVLVDVANGFRGVYNFFYGYNLSLGIVNSIFGFLNPINWFSAALHLYRAHEWKQGRDWLDRSEDLWNGLINCHRFETISVTSDVHECDEYLESGDYLDWEYCMDACDYHPDDCYSTVTTTEEIFVRRPSDGLFCDDRQTVNGLAPNNVLEARGVNHNEETNTTFLQTDQGNDEMERLFNLIWDRTDIFGTPLASTGC